MTVKQRFWICLLLLSALLLGTGCSAHRATRATAVITEMRDSIKLLPDGRVYTLRESDGFYLLTDTLLTTLYGERAPLAADSVLDAAVFLSYKSPCELAVFCCRNRDSTRAVSEMCLLRLDALRREWSSNEDVAHLANASVTVRGNWVVFCACTDVNAALRAFRRSI